MKLSVVVKMPWARGGDALLVVMLAVEADTSQGREFAIRILSCAEAFEEQLTRLRNEFVLN
jgi:hypothetical protein